MVALAFQKYTYVFKGGKADRPMDFDEVIPLPYQIVRGQDKFADTCPVQRERELFEFSFGGFPTLRAFGQMASEKDEIFAVLTGQSDNRIVCAYRLHDSLH